MLNSIIKLLMNKEVMNMDLLVVGSINMDYICYMDALPNPGETVRADEFKRLSGGKGANQAVAAAKSAIAVQMLGCVGDDGIGELMSSNLFSSGVNTDIIYILEETPSGMAFINVNKDGENNIVILPGSNAKVSNKLLDENLEAFKATKAVLLQHEIPLETVDYALKLAKQFDKITILNPAPAYPLKDETLKLTDILILNEHELSIVSNMQTDTIEKTDTAANLLISKGVNRVIVTLGSKGLIDYFENEKYAHIAFKVNAVDSTAAGDTFIGAFCAEFLNGANRQDCIDYAQKAAALSVTKKGAQESIPTKKQIESTVF